MGATLTVIFAVIFSLLTLAILAFFGAGVYSLITEGLENHDAGPRWLYSPSSGAALLGLVGITLFGFASAGFAFVLWYAFLNRY